ncbi:hypothetical protein I6944_02365 [Helicobacter pylori]|nr:hypothetical protein [Helicobacter pylori]WRC37131.1 hypothetical protein E5L17_05965 [Helicobacter pylori]
MALLWILALYQPQCGGGLYQKITWFCVGYIALWGLTLFMGRLTYSTIEDYS